VLIALTFSAHRNGDCGAEPAIHKLAAQRGVKPEMPIGSKWWSFNLVSPAWCKIENNGTGASADHQRVKSTNLSHIDYHEMLTW
jgi:hypothetical protein